MRDLINQQRLDHAPGHMLVKIRRDIPDAKTPLGQAAVFENAGFGLQRSRMRIGPAPVFAKDGGDPGEFPAYGADAVRWGLLAMSSGQDVRFNEEKVSQAQQLTNKLWNASRLILLRVDPEARAAARPQTPEDHWILSRLERSRAAVAEAIDEFEFSKAALALYDYVCLLWSQLYLNVRGTEANGVAERARLLDARLRVPAHYAA